MQLFENVVDLRIKFPDTGLSEVAVNAFEKCVAIKGLESGRDPIENAIHQLAPPAFVVILARAVDRGTWRRFFPAGAKCLVERLRIEPQPDPFADGRIMLTDALR